MLNSNELIKALHFENLSTQSISRSNLYQQLFLLKQGKSFDKRRNFVHAFFTSKPFFQLSLSVA